MLFFCLKVLRLEAFEGEGEKTPWRPLLPLHGSCLRGESSCEIAEVFRFFHIFSLVALPGVVYFIRSLDFGQHQGTLAYLVENNY